jgi:hypothetical protein
MIDSMAVCVCGSRNVLWRDCDRHENDCYVLMCYECGLDDYDCGQCVCSQIDPLPIAHEDGCPIWEAAKNEQIERETQ